RGFAARPTPYEATKRAGERLVEAYAVSGRHAVIVHPARVYGPGPCNDANALTRVIDLYLRGRFRVRLQDGDVLGSYVHAADVADGIRRAAHAGRPGAHYVLGGENFSFRAFLDLVGELSGTRQRVVALPRRAAPAARHPGLRWARAAQGFARRRAARARLFLFLGARRGRGRVLAPARLVRAYGSAAGPAAPLRGFHAAPGRDPGARRLASRGTHAARLGARARALASGTGLARRRTAARDPGRSHRRPGPRHPCGVSPRPHAGGGAARVHPVRGAAVPLFRLLGAAVPRRAAVR